MKLFIIVCNDFHVSAGPFKSKRDAAKVALRFTRHSPCEYMVVPFEMDSTFEGDVAEQDYTPKGYL